MDVTDLTALELGEKLRKREISIREALEATWRRIEAREEKLHCYVTLNREEAYAKADLLQREIMDGNVRSPFMGVPYAVKDNICTRGLRTTCGSAMLEHFVPSYDATAVSLLERAGAILIGKTNLDEFAMGSSTETSYFGATANPWDETRVAGGSSGGSAVAVASGECFFALGSDTGGSVRQPASHCGVVGIKPTYGGISRHGLVAYASSMDQIGTLTKDGRDGRALLALLGRKDSKDSTSAGLCLEGKPVEGCRGEGALKKCCAWKWNEAGSESGGELPERAGRGLRVGILRDFLKAGVSEEVEEAVRTAGSLLEKRGALVEETSLGVAEMIAPTYYVIACAEASSNLERYDGIKYGLRRQREKLHDTYATTRAEGFGSEVKRRILLGTFVLSEGYYDAYFLKALRARRLIREACDKAFAKFDLLLCPVAPSTAPKLGESLADPISTYQWDVHTALANLAGLPAVSVPFGRSEKGLPIGVQLVGGFGDEDLLLRVQEELMHGEV